MRRILFALCLCGSVAIPLSTERKPHFTEVYSKEEFARRRAQVYDAIGPKSVAVVKGNEGMPGYQEFRQSNEFFYLCGIEAPGAILLLDGTARSATVFLPPRNPRREASEGPLLTPEDAVPAITGVERVAEAAAFTASLNAIAGEREALYAPTAPQELEAMSRDLASRYNAERRDDPWDGRPSREAHFISLLRQSFPSLEFRDLTPILDRLRLIKSAEEIAVIRKATELSAASILEAMKSTRPGVYEYELDALAQFIYFRNGAQGLAYYALVAGGRNAWMPHYHTGQAALRDGDLVLMDFAPDYHYQTADVTRMWPVNGKWSRWQRELYGFYMRGYQGIIKNIRPGVPVTEIIAAASREWEAALAETKWSEEKYRQAAERFVAQYQQSRSLGHWTGMAVHDVGGRAERLQPGMVFTIEPQFRVPEDEIYIRLEDMLLVTANGVENLSAALPMEMTAIEKVIAQRGLLESYPRHLPHDTVRPHKTGSGGR